VSLTLQATPLVAGVAALLTALVGSAGPQAAAPNLYQASHPLLLAEIG
jgi:hypothetical protein